MRTYQRLVIARCGSEIVAENPAYPHNFLIVNDASHKVKVGKTGVRYNDLTALNNSGPAEMVGTLEDNPPATVEWPPASKTSRRKKTVKADDSEASI